MTMAQQLTDPIAFHGEGAVWYDGWGGLRWVDMLAGDILSLDERTGAVTRLHVDPRVAAALRPRENGGFVVATERGFALWSDDGLEWESGPLWDEAVRFNEGACDPQGRFLCGTMAYSRDEGAAAMWRLSTDGTVERLFDDVTISNGLGFTSAGERAYYVDSRTRRIDVFDADAAGELVGRRPFVSLPDGVGGPDGLCVDREDGVWIALYNGGAVRHYDAHGVWDATVEVPVSRPTSCTLGGEDLRTLYVTTSRENLPEDAEPEAGSVFTARVDVPGVPVRTARL